MNRNLKMTAKFSFLLLLVLSVLATVLPVGQALAQTPSETPVLPTQPPAQPAGKDRPVLSVSDYYVEGGGKNVDPWTPFNLKFDVHNSGQDYARNVVVSFSSEDFVSLQGGVATLPDNEADIDPGKGGTYTHPFKVSDMSTWKYSGLLIANLSYTDMAGTPYQTMFTFYLGINQQPSGPTRTPTAPAAAQKPLMVVKSYLTDLDPLQPGSNFKLKLFVTNLGASLASSVSLVYGGGVSAGQTDPMGTPQAGGVSVSGSELTNFAPLGQSNIVQLGDVAVNTIIETSQEFVVNVTTQPGAYPLKVSFVYTDSKGNRMIDDQVITLLVLSLPRLEFSVYRPPLQLNVGETGQLPLQITNISKKAAVLGNLTLSAPSGELSNNTGMIGSLEPGGYFTLDAMYTPSQAGKIPLKFEIRYTDDFNQLRTYTETMEVEVQEALPTPETPMMPLLDEKGNPVMDEKGNPVMVPADQGMGPVDGGMGPMPEKEAGFFAKIWNAIKGFFGVKPADNFGEPTGPDGINPEIPQGYGG